MTRESNGNKRLLRFGDFIVAAYQTWGWRRANEIARRAADTPLIQFRGRQRMVIVEP